ncbi:hypothetical protein NQ315_014947 [Exocentrus adspersus]|uniref:Uncharacterized protein n=1 Tax=Exocentrus adspersus TaxID=1586481 RepID=A0AAV8VA96_9CUCU|nr:hypothetical protein NQ315_014947 [Exocentrus adspersus]
MPGRAINGQSRQLILNAIDYFTRKKENSGPLRVAEALQVSLKTVSRICGERQKGLPVETPGQKRNKPKKKSEDLPDGIKTSVRNTIYDMKQNGKHFPNLAFVRNESTISPEHYIGALSIIVMMAPTGSLGVDPGFIQINLVRIFTGTCCPLFMSIGISNHYYTIGKCFSWSFCPGVSKCFIYHKLVKKGELSVLDIGFLYL